MCTQLCSKLIPSGGYENKAIFGYRLDWSQWHDSIALAVYTHIAYSIHFLSCVNILLLGGAVWAAELAIFSIRVALVDKTRQCSYFW